MGVFIGDKTVLYIDGNLKRAKYKRPLESQNDRFLDGQKIFLITKYNTTRELGIHLDKKIISLEKLKNDSKLLLDLKRKGMWKNNVY